MVASWEAAMAVYTTFECDGCGVVDRKGSNWRQVVLTVDGGLSRDASKVFCPQCWKAMLKAAQARHAILSKQK